MSPVTKTVITAGVVNIQSPRMTFLAVIYMAWALLDRFAMNIKKAMPTPVPDTTTADKIWSNFKMR